MLKTHVLIFCPFLFLILVTGIVQFNITGPNQPPSPPILNEIKNVSTESVVLTWTSGSDPENNPVYDIFEFGIDNNYTIHLENITAYLAKNLSSFLKYTWRVKTCDIFGACSDWVSSDFIVCLKRECPSCREKELVSGAPGVESEAEKFVAVLICPNSVFQNETLRCFLNFKSSASYKVLYFAIAFKNVIVDEKIVNNYLKNTEKELILERNVTKVPLGEQIFTFLIYTDKEKLMEKNFKLTILSYEKVTCGNKVCENWENEKICPQDCKLEVKEVKYNLLLFWLLVLVIALSLLIFKIKRYIKI